MADDALDRKLQAIFVGELAEHIGAINRDLIALERGGAEDQLAVLLQQLYRAVHSLKGAARAVNVEPIEAVCHRLEDVFDDARSGRIALTEAIMKKVFAAVDAIQSAGAQLAAGGIVDQAPFGAIVSELSVLSVSQGEPTSRPGLPAAGPASRPVSPLPKADGPPAAGHGGGMIRVHAARLNRMTALESELAVVRHRLAARAREVTELREQMVAWTRGHRKKRPAVSQGESQSTRLSRANVVDGHSRSSATTGVDRQVAIADKISAAVGRLAAEFRTDMRLLEEASLPLETELQEIRLQRFDDACQGLDRLIRDLAHAEGKEVDLIVIGGEVELDRSILETLRDPLRQLIRNAVAHGIESVAERARLNKNTRGQIVVHARFRNNRVEVAVSDDGRGLDLSALRRKLRERGLPEPQDDHEAARAAFHTGVTTAPTAGVISGRGMGLDIVRAAVNDLRGAIDVTFEPGRGTKFLIDLPLTLGRTRAALVSAGGQTFAIDLTQVQGVRRLREREIRILDHRTVLLLEGMPVPVIDLSDLLQIPGIGNEPDASASRRYAILLGGPAGRAAIRVEGIEDEQDVVVKNLGPRLKHVPNVVGATVLPDGRLVLLLDGAALAQAARAADAPAARIVTPDSAVPMVRRILVADDSITTRTLVQTILENAGYEVMVAADGHAAWKLLRERGADLVVSDVDMPETSGIELTEAIRGDHRLRNLPVILVTALESERDRMRGLEAGADAYLVKSTFEQTRLLQTVMQLLGGSHE